MTLVGIALREFAQSRQFHQNELHVALQRVADEPARGMLQGHETVAKSALQRTEPWAIGLIDEDDHGGPAAERSGCEHEGLRDDVRRWRLSSRVAIEAMRGIQIRTGSSRIGLDIWNMYLYRSHEKDHLSRRQIDVPTDKGDRDSYLEAKSHS